MSAQHTQGRLKAFNLYAHPEIRDQDDGFVATTKDDKPRSVADARRLVACWNACQRLDTDLLERLGRPGSPGIHPAPQDRIEELLAALEYHQQQTRPIQRTIDVIAKVKGGAA